MPNQPKPPDPSRRRLFTWFGDKDAAAAVGAEAGRLVRAAREAAQELASVGEEAAAALNEALTVPDAPAQPSTEWAAEAPPGAELGAAPNADLHSQFQQLTDAVTTLETQAAADHKTLTELTQALTDIASGIQALDRKIDERLPQAQTDAEQSDLRRLKGLVPGLVSLLLGIVGATGTALYEDLVGDAVYAPLRDWLQAQMQAASVQAQPASPLPPPDAAAPLQFTGPVQAQRNRMHDRRLTAQERLAAGLLLDEWGVLPPGLDDFIPVPGVRFRIARYPVTNHQYRRFVDDGGYGQAKWWRLPWWSERGWELRVKYGWTQPRWWDDPKFNRASQPVVGVSWWEAEAYCNWLNLSATGQHYKPTGLRARLPTREQWMLAARNGQPAPGDETLDYPWGGPFDSTLANTAESKLEQPTPVDMHPDGATPAGVYDMAGNVWEWTADRNPPYNDEFWLKGGSWRSSPERTRASAADSRNIVRLWDGSLGFRCVCVPISHG